MQILAGALALLLFIGCNDSNSARSEDPAVKLPSAEEDAPAFSGNNAYLHCARLCALGPRPSGSTAYARQLDYLAESLQKAGWKTERHSFSLSNGVQMTNLRATFGENKETIPPLLISCHIDTKSGIPGFTGADDGASAAGVMIELARILAKKPQYAQKIELIFFDGEESFAPRMTENDGLYGSRYDIMRRQRHNIPLPNWQINLDMVGARNKTIAVPAWDTDPDMLEHYAEAIETLHFPSKRWTLHPGSYLDDHRPYANAGVASLNLICQFLNSNWWHTDKDDISRISSSSLDETGRFVLQLISQILDDKRNSLPDSQLTK